MNPSDGMFLNGHIIRALVIIRLACYLFFSQPISANTCKAVLGVKALRQRLALTSSSQIRDGSGSVVVLGDKQDSSVHETTFVLLH